MENYINKDNGLVDKVEYIEEEIPDIRAARVAKYTEEVKTPMTWEELKKTFCSNERGTPLKFTDNGELIEDENVPVAFKGDVRELRSQLDEPNSSGVESFDCNSSECLVDKDKLMSIAVDGHKRYDDRVKDILREYVSTVAVKQQYIKDIEKQIKEIKLNAEALVLAIHHDENISVKWMEKKEKISYGFTPENNSARLIVTNLDNGRDVTYFAN